MSASRNQGRCARRSMFAPSHAVGGLAMRRFICFAFAMTVLPFAGSALGVDLTAIDRTISKLPELRSKSPGHCPLVFGPEAAKHVWLVHDDDVLYVDRNSNGDLTEADER